MTSSIQMARKQGSALLISLWVLVLLTLLVGSFAFEMQLESRLTSYRRKRFHAEMLAQSGLEYAKAIMSKADEAKPLEIADLPEEEAAFMSAALAVQRGTPFQQEYTDKDDQTFKLIIESPEGRRNLNLMNDDEWRELFESANVPSSDWDEMIDSLKDWIDRDDLTSLSGAESDDSFYQDAGYPVRNGYLDSVEELLLVKGWTEEVLYGTQSSEATGEVIFGIAKMLTVWGDAQIDINSINQATADSFPDDDPEWWALYWELRKEVEENPYDEFIYEQYRNHINNSGFKLKSNFVKVTSIGGDLGSQYQIECIFMLQGREPIVVFREEGPVLE